MKKIITIGLLLLLIVLVSGCTSSQTDAPTSDNSNTVPTARATSDPVAKDKQQVISYQVALSADGNIIKDDFSNMPTATMPNSLNIWLSTTYQDMTSMVDDIHGYDNAVNTYEALLNPDSIDYQNAEAARQKSDAAAKDEVLNYNNLVDAYNNAYGAQYGDASDVTYYN